MKRYVLSTMTAMFCAGALTAAQTPQPAQQPSQPAPTATQRTTEPRAAASMAGNMTYVGCLYKDKDVPGRTPNVAEKVGIMEDYILADAAPKSGASATPGATGTSGTAGAAASASAKKMFKVERIDDDQLKSLVGKRVEVVGKIEDDDAKEGAVAKTDKNPVSPDAIDLPEFEATSIRAVDGTCPATPSK